MCWFQNDDQTISIRLSYIKAYSTVYNNRLIELSALCIPQTTKLRQKRKNLTSPGPMRARPGENAEDETRKWECRQSPYLEFVNNVSGGRIIFKKAIDLLQKPRKVYAFLICKNFDGHEVKLCSSTHFEIDGAGSVRIARSRWRPVCAGARLPESGSWNRVYEHFFGFM